MKARKHVPLPGRKLTWTTAATNAEQRSCELCHAGAEADCVWKLFPTAVLLLTARRRRLSSITRAPCRKVMGVCRATFAGGAEGGEGNLVVLDAGGPRFGLP